MNSGRVRLGLPINELILLLKEGSNEYIVYEPESFKKAFDKFKGDLNRVRVLGEINPFGKDNPSARKFNGEKSETIDILRASHAISDLSLSEDRKGIPYFEGPVYNVIGHVEYLNNPNVELELSNINKNGFSLGLRAITENGPGTVIKQDGMNITIRKVVKIITYDIIPIKDSIARTI